MGAEEGEVYEAIVNAAAEALDLIDHQQLIRALQAESFERPERFYLVAYSAPVDFSAETAGIVRRALKSEDQKVREFAAIAAGLIGWQGLRRLLEEAYMAERPGPAKLAMEDALRAIRASAP